MTLCNSMPVAAGRQAQIDALVREHLEEVFTAAVREYAARVERDGSGVPQPVLPGALTATEVVVAASDLIRSADLNLFDVAMWFRRPVAPAAQAHAGAAAGGAHA